MLFDVVLFFTFTLVDILLVRSFDKLIEKNKKVFDENSLSTIEKTKMKNKISLMEQAMNKIVKVIITNTIIILITKSLDIVVSISKFKIWKQDLTRIYLITRLNEFCHTVKICSIYEELVNILYMLTYCFSIVMFYHLNRNFQSGLRNVFKFSKNWNYLNHLIFRNLLP